MEKRKVISIIIGLMYSILSVLFLPGIYAISLFIGLFASDSGTFQAHLFFYGIVATSLVLIISNILMWIFVVKDNVRGYVISMITPIIYLPIFFTLFYFVGSIFYLISLVLKI